jgi:hypothetical protein
MIPRNDAGDWSNRMNRCRRSLFCLAVAIPAILALAAPLFAAASPIIYATGFENPPFIAGLSLVGQDGWVGVPVLSPNAAIISTDKPTQGRQSVRVLGGDLEHQDFINEVTDGYYDAIGSYRHTVEYDTGGTQVVRVSAHVRIDGPLTPGDDFFSAALAAVGVDTDGSSDELGELKISSDGYVHCYDGNPLVPTFLVSAPISLGEWHDLAIVDDFAARTYSFVVDGQPLGTFPFIPSAKSNIFRRGSLITYTAPDTATSKKTDYVAHYDRSTIQVTGK